MRHPFCIFSFLNLLLPMYFIISAICTGMNYLNIIIIIIQVYFNGIISNSNTSFYERIVAPGNFAYLIGLEKAGFPGDDKHCTINIIIVFFEKGNRVMNHKASFSKYRNHKRIIEVFGIGCIEIPWTILRSRTTGKSNQNDSNKEYKQQRLFCEHSIHYLIS